MSFAALSTAAFAKRWEEGLFGVSRWFHGPTYSSQSRSSTGYIAQKRYELKKNYSVRAEKRVKPVDNLVLLTTANITVRKQHVCFVILLDVWTSFQQAKYKYSFPGRRERSHKSDLLLFFLLAHGNFDAFWQLMAMVVEMICHCEPPFSQFILCLRSLVLYWNIDYMWLCGQVIGLSCVAESSPAHYCEIFTVYCREIINLPPSLHFGWREMFLSI